MTEPTITTEEELRAYLTEDMPGNPRGAMLRTLLSYMQEYGISPFVLGSIYGAGLIVGREVERLEQSSDG